MSGTLLQDAETESSCHEKAFVHCALVIEACAQFHAAQNLLTAIIPVAVIVGQKVTRVSRC